jgi:hypothetical protein
MLVEADGIMRVIPGSANQHERFPLIWSGRTTGTELDFSSFDTT